MQIGGLLAFVLFLVGNLQGQRVETIALVDQWLAEASISLKLMDSLSQADALLFNASSVIRNVLALLDPLVSLLTVKVDDQVVNNVNYLAPNKDTQATYKPPITPPSTKHGNRGINVGPAKCQRATSTKTSNL